MNRIELISANNAERIDAIGPELAQTYKVAFAGSPWFEVSRCGYSDCQVEFTPDQPGCMCIECGQPLCEAYSETKLVDTWRSQIVGQGALLEVAFDGEYPQRATLVRPTNPDELWTRKYQDQPAMAPVLKGILPAEFAWIEDTFANRDRIPTGNLRDRGQTLDRISQFYGGDTVIATRTLAEGIVASTLRDKGSTTSVWIGSQRAGTSIVNDRLKNHGYELPTIPDRRTLLVVRPGGGR